MILSDTVLVALIASVPPTVVALVTLVVSILNHRKIEVVRHATDGMKDALVTVTKSDSFQKGHTAGVADEKSSSNESKP